MDDKILLNGLILVKRYFHENITVNNYLELINLVADDINEHYENYGSSLDVVYSLDKNGVEVQENVTFENVVPIDIYDILKSDQTGIFKKMNSISLPIYSKLENLNCIPKSLIFRKFHEVACS